jgi:hypothetical protein
MNDMPQTNKAPLPRVEVISSGILVPSIPTTPPTTPATSPSTTGTPAPPPISSPSPTTTVTTRITPATGKAIAATTTSISPRATAPAGTAAHESASASRQAIEEVRHLRSMCVQGCQVASACCEGMADCTHCMPRPYPSRRRLPLARARARSHPSHLNSARTHLLVRVD